MGRSLALACLTVLCAAVAVPAVGAADFNDGQYHQYVLYDVDTPRIDVLVVPPASGLAVHDLAAIKQSITAWKAGIQSGYAPSFLRSGMKIGMHVLGVDVPPKGALQDPEIIVFTANYNPVLLLGVGEQVPVGVCRKQAAEDHVHLGGLVRMMECKDGGKQCLVVNTSFALGTAHDMYNLNAHEFGHCLGLGHVGDGLDFTAANVPVRDIMSYTDQPGQVHCVSNMDLVMLAHLYSQFFGQTGAYPTWHAGEYHSFSPSAYRNVACKNPSEDIFMGTPLAAGAVAVQEPAALDGLAALPSGLGLDAGALGLDPLAQPLQAVRRGVDGAVPLLG